ncbi:MAG TPA: hypothetical protein VLX68_12615 [Chitinivibrionales bacterium]|nr:hypothetical protein [Chitinivibrionales bacterium]
MDSTKTNGFKSEYVPGVCNIGPAERRLRRKSGWIGIGVGIGLWAALAFVKAPQAWRLLVFFPASLAASGYLQSAFHFCANFGMRGVFNFGPEVGKTDTVLQAEFRKKDRRKASLILLLSGVIGAIAAAAAFLVKT